MHYEFLNPFEYKLIRFACFGAMIKYNIILTIDKEWDAQDRRDDNGQIQIVSQESQIDNLVSIGQDQDDQHR